MRNPLQTKKYDGVWLAFGLCLLAAAAIFIPFQIVDKGLFIYAGDFNSQQISFYQYANDFVKQGGQFSWATDLGSSFVNSYSFYLLGSPFFWLSLLFPSSWVPYLMCPLLCLKFAVAGAGAFVWMRRYTKSRNLTIVGACLYAFSGFTVYNVFFNHFLDVIALFPFVLWALDEAVYEKRRGPFALLVALNLVNNYFFFAGQIVFLLLYFFVKVLSGDYRLKLKHFGWLFFEAVLGVLIGGALLFPAVVCLADNPRTVSLSSGFGFLLYGKVQQYFAIFYSMFLPPDPCYMPNVFRDCAVKHTSLTAYLPVVGMCGVLAYLRSKPRTAFRRILFICLLMAMVPVLNSSFYALNSSYYARWFYMPILLMALVSVQAMEDDSIDLAWGIKASLAVTLSFLVFGLIPQKGENGWSLGVAEYASKFWLTMAQAILALALFWMAYTLWHKRPQFARNLLAAVLGFSVFYSVLHIAIGKFPQWEGDKGYYSEMYQAKSQVQLPEEGFYRIDTVASHDNVGVWLNRSNLRCFNSTVAPSIMEFYPSVGVKRDVSSKPAELLSGRNLNALRSLLGCEYLLAPLDEVAEGEKSVDGQPGWVRVGDQGAYAVWKNANALPIGFTYEHYISLEDLKEVTDTSRSLVLLRAVGLDEEQIAQYGSLLTELPEAGRDTMEGTFKEDVAARKAQSMENVWTDNSGFGGAISLEKDNLVFFSVPYDAGFTATVNGEAAAVLKVSNGMMAVPVPAGENVIEFQYGTPLFRESCLAVGAALLVFLIYMGWAYQEPLRRILARRKPKKENRA